jgi:ABC-type cobalamin/Fe3+-siderophores transport system ATPase subunit
MLPDPFTYGATWLRADFHLHTRADKEFVYTGEENSYVSAYVAGLKEADIRVGVVTNHNKFEQNEFKALRKKARKESIFLLPGVELSLNDGANGIHTLVVFSDQWLENGNDYISPFIATMFPGKATTEYQTENGRSDKNILQAVAELNKTARDYFLVFAHVEQRSGLWLEMGGGKLGDWATPRYEGVRKRTLGFQKVRTHDRPDAVCRSKVKAWLQGWYPAEVEGSDCKAIAEIGKGEKCYLKVGAFSYDAVKFALTDANGRTAATPHTHTHSHIRSMRFAGGTLGARKLHFSPELNSLIGIRGSGKSSILEALRYVLEIPFGEKAGDTKYKQALVDFTLKSGGKVELDAVDRYGQLYTIRRVLKEPCSEVLIDGKLQPGVSIQETVLHKPIYFGQKDLSSTGEGFEKDLVDKLLGARLDAVRRKISDQKVRVGEEVDRLCRIANVQDQLDEQRHIKLDTEHRLEFYTKHGIEAKLQKRLNFDADIRAMKKGSDLTHDVISDLEELLAKHEDDIRNFQGYVSKDNQALFERFFAQYQTVLNLVDHLKAELNGLGACRKELATCQVDLLAIRQGMVEEFAAIERQLAEELKSNGAQNISSDDFLKLKKRLASACGMISELEKQGTQKQTLESALLEELKALNELWHEEFTLIKAELDQVGSGSSSLSIDSEFKADKLAFLGFMNDVFKGSGIRKTTFQEIVEKYSDFLAIYRDLEQAKTLFGRNPQKLTELFMENLKSLLTYQTPNKFTIRYRGKELQHHSLGQRASALILFVLSQRENDVIIIDQPEDDLDNQTIYEDVIKLIRELKSEVQFIFATHNPNIPVLGDADQVHACSFMDDKVAVCSGSVDSADTQNSIVNIMEGGQEAFNRRKEIYQIWKP